MSRRGRCVDSCALRKHSFDRHCFLFASVLCYFGFFAGTSYAYPSNRDKIPNAWEFLYLGHAKKPGGSGTHNNAFGTAFMGAGWQWTQALCQADSDGDGFTNGQELGDPNCTWQEGDPQPSCGGCPSHPGDSEDAAMCGQGEKYCGQVEEKESRLRLHGALMLIAWLVLAPAGVAIATFRRQAYGGQQSSDGGGSIAQSGTSIAPAGVTSRDAEEGETALKKPPATTLMLMHKLTQVAVIIITIVALILPYAGHSHGDDDGGGHSHNTLVSVHGALAYIIVALACCQFLLWVARPYVQAKARAGKDNATELTEVAQKGDVVQNSTIVDTSKGGGESAIWEKASENWLATHRWSGILCFSLAGANVLLGSWRFDQLHTDSIFKITALILLPLSIIVLIAARVLGGRVGAASSMSRNESATGDTPSKA
ncbi:unnamed protein product [Amoebophrya sp. A25]|nr:unnamed protein product [Amoebophrya sp. A25]|eukprot:GSA25T00019564001.1